MTQAPEHDHGEGALRQAAARKGSFLQTMKAVAWSFFGVRKSSEHEKDVNQLNPVHVIIAGILAALIFIGVLVALVHWVVGSSAHGG
jgi:cytochrome b561